MISFTQKGLYYIYTLSLLFFSTSQYILEVTPYQFLEDFSLCFSLFIYLFIYFFWLYWIFVHAFSDSGKAGATLICGARGFSLWSFLSLWSTGSKVLGLSSWGTQAELRCGMWDLPRRGIKLMSLCWQAGRFPCYFGNNRKSSLIVFKLCHSYYIMYICFSVSCRCHYDCSILQLQTVLHWRPCSDVFCIVKSVSLRVNS